MPDTSGDTTVVVKPAWLHELKEDLSDIDQNGQKFQVQFNPESLKLTYANQIQPQPNGSSNGQAAAGNQSQGVSAQQFVGTSTTKLTVQLWFDVSAATTADFMVDDVRRLTGKVLYFMKPKARGSGSAAQRTPPGVRFSWGNFLFDGVVESIEENIEFFSSDGNALRASMTLNLIRQDTLVPDFSGKGDGKVPGTRPLWPASSGQSMQGMADARPGGRAAGGSVPPPDAQGSNASQQAAGRGPGGLTPAGGSAFQSGSWQRIALANGIENPRALEAGKLIDLAAQKPLIITG